MIDLEFKSILDLLKAFPDEATCVAHPEELRWNGNVTSPFDPTSTVYSALVVNTSARTLANILTFVQEHYLDQLTSL